MKEISLWIEKYRPRKLDDMVLQQDIKEFFQQCIDKKEIPHLVLSGKPGCGKTSIAKILVNELDAECLSLNASDERGIDTIRYKVGQFLMMEGVKRWKIVFMDEADMLTSPALHILRNMMETFAQYGRFILSVNYLDRIIEPIRSRCQVIEFKPVDIKSQLFLLKRILDNEKVKYDEEDLLKIIDDCEGDLRKIINESQKLVRGDRLIYKSVKDLVDVKKLLELAKEKKYTDLRKILQEQALDTTYMLQKLFDLVFEEYSVEKAVRVVGEYLWRDGIVMDKRLNLFCAFVEVAQEVV